MWRFLTPARVAALEPFLAQYRVVRAGELSPETAQTSGMTRMTAIDGTSVGARKL